MFLITVPSKSLTKNMNLSLLQQHLSPLSACHSLEIPTISKQQEFNQFPMDKNQVPPYRLLSRSHLIYVTIGNNRPLQLLFNAHINTGVPCTFFNLFGLHYTCFFLFLKKRTLTLQSDYDVCLKDKRTK